MGRTPSPIEVIEAPEPARLKSGAAYMLHRGRRAVRRAALARVGLAPEDLVNRARPAATARLWSFGLEAVRPPREAFSLPGKPDDIHRSQVGSLLQSSTPEIDVSKPSFSADWIVRNILVPTHAPVCDVKSSTTTGRSAAAPAVVPKAKAARKLA